MQRLFTFRVTSLRGWAMLIIFAASTAKYLPEIVIVDIAASHSIL